MATENLETKILNLEKEFWQAVKDQDAGTITKLTDDPCLVAGSSEIEHTNLVRAGGQTLDFSCR